MSTLKYHQLGSFNPFLQSVKERNEKKNLSRSNKKYTTNLCLQQYREFGWLKRENHVEKRFSSKPAKFGRVGDSRKRSKTTRSVRTTTRTILPREKNEEHE